MEKTLTIKIANQGDVRGTVGWLLKNADSIKIGETKGSKQGAWLKDMEGAPLLCLAIRGYHDNEPDISLSENGRGMMFSACDFSLSAAAWEKVEEIQTEVVEIMDDLWEKESKKEIKLVKE